MEANSSRAVGRILGIGKNMCLYRNRKYTKNIEPKETPNSRVNVIEMESCTVSSREKSECPNLSTVAPQGAELPCDWYERRKNYQ